METPSYVGLYISRKHKEETWSFCWNVFVTVLDVIVFLVNHLDLFWVPPRFICAFYIPVGLNNIYELNRNCRLRAVFFFFNSISTSLILLCIFLSFTNTLSTKKIPHQSDIFILKVEHIQVIYKVSVSWQVKIILNFWNVLNCLHKLVPLVSFHFRPASLFVLKSVQIILNSFIC